MALGKASGKALHKQCLRELGSKGETQRVSRADTRCAIEANCSVRARPLGAAKFLPFSLSPRHFSLTVESAVLAIGHRSLMMLEAARDTLTPLARKTL